MPWTQAQINAPTDQFQAAETDRLNSIAHGRSLDEQSLLQDRYDNRFAAEAMLKKQQSITDRKNQLTDLGSARTNALQDRNDLYGFYDDNNTYIPGLNQKSQESLDESRNKTARKTANKKARTDWRTDNSAYEFSSKRYATVKAEEAANRQEITRLGGSVFHVNPGNPAKAKQESRTRSFIQTFNGRYLSIKEGKQAENALSQFADGMAPTFNKYNLDHYRAAIYQIHDARRIAANAAGRLPNQDVNAELEARIEAAKLGLLAKDPELSQAWNALQSRKQQIDRELQILAPKALSPPGPRPGRNRRNRNNNAGAGLGPILRQGKKYLSSFQGGPQGPPVAGPSGPPTGGPAASLGYGSVASQALGVGGQPSGGPRGSHPQSIHNPAAYGGAAGEPGIDEAQDYLETQGISVQSYGEGIVKLQKGPIFGVPEEDGTEIVYLLDADNYMTLSPEEQAAGPNTQTGEIGHVSSEEEIDEFKYRVTEAVQAASVNIPPRLYGILTQSLGPMKGSPREDQTPGGFFESDVGAGQPLPGTPAAAPAGTPPSLLQTLGP